MRTNLATVIAQLRAADQPSWRQIIDDADLDGPVVVDHAAEALVAPYRWLIKRVGRSKPLTAAGYLAPEFVADAMAPLAWSGGEQNREARTPLLKLRRSAQWLGLLKVNGARVGATRLGFRLAKDPTELWWHLADSLRRTGTDLQVCAGYLYLLTVAAGHPRDDDLLADGLATLGWTQRRNHQPLAPSTAFAAARPTWEAFRRLGLLVERAAWDRPEPPPTPQARMLARAALIGRPYVPPPPPPPLTGEPVVHVCVTLRDTEPEVWRKLVVPESLTLREFHTVLQIAMGWQDRHMHVFEIFADLYGELDDELADSALGNEDCLTIAQVADEIKEFGYDYDLGDGWRHDVRVRRGRSDAGSVTPHLVDGARACPPEDCGGPVAYQHLLEVLADPSHEQHAELTSWVGSYDPQALDIPAINAALERTFRTSPRRRPTH